MFAGGGSRTHNVACMYPVIKNPIHFTDVVDTLEDTIFEKIEKWMVN